jgi:hypothetical protein
MTTANALSEDLVKRLVFVKYLHLLGVEQARRPEPLSSASLLMQHDAIELFLQLAAEHLNVGRQRIEFMEYFDLIDSVISPRALPAKESVRRLNKARVALKHHGTFPSVLDTAGFSDVARSLFSASEIVFGLSFDSLSLAGLVLDQEVRSCLERADQNVAAADYQEAICAVAEAFARLRLAYGMPRDGHGHLSSQMRALEARLEPRFHDHGLEELAKTVESIQDEVVLLRQGIDTRKLTVFRHLTPHVAIAMAGNARFVSTRPLDASADTVQYCYDFVIECALQLQDVHTAAQRFRVEHVWSRFGML